MKKKLLVSLMLVLALILSSSFVIASEVDITILHTNDTHSRVEEGKYAGMGFAKIATLAEKARRQTGNVLLLDAGDTFHGQTIANLVKGESIARIYNTLGYDAMVPGNHDFNYGWERLDELNKITNFPIISANITNKDNKFIFTPSIIKDIDGVKVAIIGLTTPETTYKTHPKNVEGLDFRDPIKSAKRMVTQVNKETNPDVIIALTHLGLSKESNYTSRKLAEKVPEIDLIIDGHSHNALEKGVLVNETPIVMAGEYTKALGVVNITVKDGKIIKGKADLITKEEAANLSKNRDTLDLIKGIKAKNKEITSTVIGKTTVNLDGERAHIRTRETNMGNLVTDAMLSATDADIAITNSGGIRASIEAGKITKNDIITVLPFGNYVVVKKVKGKVILDAIEHGISKYPAHEGLFPQVAGISFVFDTSQPAGKRGLELRVDGQPVDPNKYYKVAINDFIAAGGDGYDMFKDTPTIQEAGSLEEVVMSYIKEQGTIKPETEGRIIAVSKDGTNYEYTIKRGDTLSKLAVMFEVKMNKLVELNNIEDPDLIYAGDDLLLPTN